jgi:hypothetical protein
MQLSATACPLLSACGAEPPQLFSSAHRRDTIEISSGRLGSPAVDMDAGVSSAQSARSQHRYDLRTLVYVSIDQANGGVVRNLTNEGIGVQVVAALPPKHQLRIRFELPHSRLRVEARGEVVWTTPSGQCGIRFLDLAPRTRRQIQEWIFGDLLEGSGLDSPSTGWMFNPPPVGVRKDGWADEEDGLVISRAARNAIPLSAPGEDASATIAGGSLELNWLIQPLSARSLAWTVNTLVVVAALLLFMLVFLLVNREAPRWPLAMTGGAVVLVGGMYWGFFEVFGGGSFGERLARLARSEGDRVEDRDARFR